MKNTPLTTLRMWTEARLVRGLLAALRLLPIELSSWLGGKVLQVVGLLLPPHRIAERNLERALPELDAAARKRVLSAMWNNLGRTAGEYPHLQKIFRAGDRHVEIRGTEILDDIKANPRPVIFFSGHMANWEILSAAAAMKGVPISPVYRRPNNPYLAKVFTDRLPDPEMTLIAKGPKAGREILKLLRQNRPVGMLIDQKLREGISVDFFGRPAKTAMAFAELGLRLGCDIIPTRIERIEGTRFRATVFPPLEHPDTGDHDENVRQMTQTATSLLESWIRERPEQWFWVHRRWPD